MIELRLPPQGFQLEVRAQAGEQVVALCRLGARRRALQRGVLLRRLMIDLHAPSSLIELLDAVAVERQVARHQIERARRTVREGALKLLSTCLELHAENVLVIFYDETVGETYDLIKEAAERLDLVVMSRYVSPTEQKEFDRVRGLSVEDKSLLESARAIITCVSAHIEGTAFRLELLKAGTQMGKRFGHMPGAVPELFSYAATIDYDHAVSRCDDLALALTVGQHARLQTYIFKPDGGREEFNLEFEIGGLLRPPITSSGIIALGTWGNIPGGETFISPMEDTANGESSHDSRSCQRTIWDS